MAAPLGFKTFNTGDVLTAADTNGYLMQGVWTFANAAARTAAVTSPQEGNVSFLKDTNSLEIYDGASWVAYGSGDITGVTAGTGISGGGTSGTVTITNDMATKIDAKGDLILGTGADTYDRLAVGTNGQVLTADSTAATGVKWAAASGAPAFVGCAAMRTSGTQNVANTTYTAVTLPSEDFDTDGFHDTTTNTSRLTIPTGKDGKYNFELAVGWGAQITTSFYLTIRKNGTAVALGLDSGTLLALYTKVDYASASVTLSAVAGDYFEFFVYQSSGGAKDIIAARFSCTYLGA